MSDRAFRSILLSTFLACFFLLHLYLSLVTRPVSSSETPGVRAGMLVTAFEGVSLDHHPIQLASLAKSNQLVIVHFWESWCGPCRVELPAIEKLYSTYKDQGVAVVGIYGESSDESVQQLVTSDALTFPVLRDTSSRWALAYGLNAFPTTFVLDSNLKVLRSHEGIDDDLESFVKAHLRPVAKSS